MKGIEGGVGPHSKCLEHGFSDTVWPVGLRPGADPPRGGGVEARGGNRDPEGATASPGWHGCCG